MAEVATHFGTVPVPSKVQPRQLFVATCGPVHGLVVVASAGRTAPSGHVSHQPPVGLLACWRPQISRADTTGMDCLTVVETVPLPFEWNLLLLAVEPVPLWLTGPHTSGFPFGTVTTPFACT